MKLILRIFLVLTVWVTCNYANAQTYTLDSPEVAEVLSGSISVTKLVQVITSVVSEEDAAGGAQLKIIITCRGGVRLLILDRNRGTMVAYAFDNDQRLFVEMERRRRTAFEDVFFESDFVRISDFMNTPYEVVFRSEYNLAIPAEEEGPDDEGDDPIIAPSPAPMPFPQPTQYPLQMPVAYYPAWPNVFMMGPPSFY